MKIISPVNGWAEKIPDATIRRLSQYVRLLGKEEERGTSVISSEDISRLCGISAYTIRRDLSYFGDFGVPGVGYQVSTLLNKIRGIISGSLFDAALLVGVNGLGRYLLTYQDASPSSLKIVAAFDEQIEETSKGSRPEQVAKVPVFAVSDLPRIARETGVLIGIVAVAPEVAEEVVLLMQRSGLKAVLNYTPVFLKSPYHGLLVENIDLLAGLDRLAFRLGNEMTREKGEVGVQAYSDFI